MSNNATSNETDLDWLARNVHFWDESAYAAMCGGVERVMWVSGSAYGQMSEFKNAVTKEQWLARRAELQSKPGWGHEAVPAWATALAQDQDGEWKWLGDNVTQYVDGFTADKIRAQCKGEVLGDWRDTLERRPVSLSDLASSVASVAAATERLTEATQTVLAAVPNLNKEELRFERNDWFERGELPPVGFECEMKRIDGRWCKAVTVGKDSGGRMVCELNDNGAFYASTSSAESFRPIRTERDVLADLIESHGQMSALIVADAIIAAGFRLEAK